MLTKKERIERVQHFQNSCLKAGLNEVAQNVFELPGPHSKTLTFCTLVHGNEIGGIEVFLHLLEELKSNKLIPKSKIRFILGNVEAYYEDQRFLETDMNRSFGLDKQRSSEEIRAKELEPFLEDTDVFIDIHQTIGPTSTPFFIFEFEEGSYNFARYLHQTIPVVTNSIKRAFKGKTSTAYTISKKGLGVTIETGQKGIEDTQISLGLEIARKAIQTDFENPIPASNILNTYTFFQIINNPKGSLELIRKLNNFDPVKSDEILAKNSEEEVRSKVDGVVLFPKYGDYAKASMELALILKPVHSKEEIIGSE